MQLRWMLPREVELVSEWTCLPGGEVQSAFSGPTDWILRYIKTYIYPFFCFLQVADSAAVSTPPSPNLRHVPTPPHRRQLRRELHDLVQPRRLHRPVVAMATDGRRDDDDLGRPDRSRGRTRERAPIRRVSHRELPRDIRVSARWRRSGGRWRCEEAMSVDCHRVEHGLWQHAQHVDQPRATMPLEWVDDSCCWAKAWAIPVYSSSSSLSRLIVSLMSSFLPWSLMLLVCSLMPICTSSTMSLRISSLGS